MSAIAKNTEEVYSTSESVAMLRLSSRPLLSPELSPKTGTSELAFDDSSYDSARRTPAPVAALETELLEIRQASNVVCSNAQDSLHEFRSCSASVKRKILSMERQITSMRSSFMDGDFASKSSLRGLEENNDGRREQLGSLMKELQAVQEMLQEKEREYEKREQENKALKQDLSRLEQLVAEATKRKNEDCMHCECQKCLIL